MDDVPLLEPDLEQFLLQVYFKMAQTQYPFMIKHEILQWAELRRQGAGAFYGEARWKAFFVYMDFYHLATTRYLPHVLETSDDLIRAQAYLLLTVYALHMTSREAIVALSSCSIRFCVAARLHLKEEEPKPVTPETLIQIQHRRRIFWCAYAIDRSICSVYDLPVSVADHHITVPYFDNIDDDQLHDVALWPSTRNSNQTARGVAPTSVLAALHVIAARQLESEIHDTLLSKDLTPESPAVAAWRERMFDKLKDWNAHSRRSTEPSQIGYTSLRWQRLIFVYGVIYLYRPTRSSACGPVGNVSVQACCQALLMFRKFQMVREIAQPWLGLLSQFQIGVTLLYCFFATPPSHWPPAYKSKDVPDAIRACSNTLAVLADRWIEAECVRDVFEVLAKEIPPGETWERPLRMQNDSRAAIEADWTALTNIVVDRPTLGMIREMIIDNFVDNAEVQNPLPNTGVRSAGGMAVADAGPLTDSSSHPVGDIGQRIAHSQTNSPPDPSVSNDDDGIAGGPFFQDGHADIFQDTDLQWSQPDNTSTMDLDTQYYLTSETDGFREESDMTLH
ncbi:hypothetical protein SCUCBS95973_008379 [Sporothrix curviconia]|uniref:Xylanolytic transcriptional activator regulatory domain-containing protein n=1 Tax=Sporothrix curviconia TaxID=1260050 RepID=A0ABP0CMK2_9PEZI